MIEIRFQLLTDRSSAHDDPEGFLPTFPRNHPVSISIYGIPGIKTVFLLATSRHMLQFVDSLPQLERVRLEQVPNDVHVRAK